MIGKKWLSAASLLVLCALATPAGAGETKIKLKDLPKAVRKAVKEKFPEAKIRGVAKEVEDDETKYEVEMTIDGKSVDVLFEADGGIEAIEKEIEAEDLPKAVLKAAKAKFPKGKIEKAEEITEEDDKVVFEVIIALKGKEPVELVIAPNGKIIVKEETKAEEDEKGEKKAEKDDDDEKGEKKAEKDDDDEKGEKKAEKDDDDEKGEKKVEKADKDDDEKEMKDDDDEKKADKDDDEKEAKSIKKGKNGPLSSLVVDEKKDKAEAKAKKAKMKAKAKAKKKAAKSED